MDLNEEKASGEATAEVTARALTENEVQEEEQQAPAQEQEPLADTEQQAQADMEQQAPADMQQLAVEDWDYERPRRGQVRTGLILAIREQEIIVDVGVKRDGIVPYADMQRMGPEALEKLSVGDEVKVYILRPEDKEGNLLVSLYMARQAQAWEHAQELYDSGQVWETEIMSYNKGGVVVPVKEIRGFVPASQVPGFPMGLSQEERLERLAKLVGEKLQVKVIEINQRKRRLILSATSAQKQWRRQQRKQLLEDLREGEVREGRVSSLASFGAFVDLGGADGLIHISELSWRRVRHPKEVVSVGQEVEVYVLRLDHERNRIGLSLKRLQPEPWALVEDKYELGQLVEGVVTNVVDFGAFAEIEAGIEGLIHVSELADMPVGHPKDVVKKGDLLLLRIIRIDARRKRLGLSLKRVLESEWAEWAARLAVAEAEKKKEEAEKLAAAQEAEEAEPPEAVEEAELPEAIEEAEPPEAIEEAEPPEAVEEAELPEAIEEAEPPEAVEEAELPEAVEEAELPEAIEEAELPEAVEEAEPPEAVEKAELPEAIEEAELPEAIEEAELPEAVEEAELPEAIEEAEQPEAVEEAELPEVVEEAEPPEAVEEAEPPEAVEEAELPEAEAQESAGSQDSQEKDASEGNGDSETSAPVSVDEPELVMAEA